MLLKNICLFALAGSASTDLDPGTKTPLVKLKKSVRTVIALVDHMVLVEVSDEDAVAAVPVEQGLDNSRSFGLSPFLRSLNLKLQLSFT